MQLRDDGMASVRVAFEYSNLGSGIQWQRHATDGRGPSVHKWGWKEISSSQIHVSSFGNTDNISLCKCNTGKFAEFFKVHSLFIFNDNAIGHKAYLIYLYSCTHFSIPYIQNRITSESHQTINLLYDLTEATLICSVCLSPHHFPSHSFVLCFQLFNI